MGILLYFLLYKFIYRYIACIKINQSINHKKEMSFSSSLFNFAYLSKNILTAAWIKAAIINITQL